MEARELRIGNWISNIHDIPMIVKAIYEDTVYVDFKGNVGGLWEFNKHEPFKPIELTEEILLKCGFDIVGYGRYHSLEFKGFRKGLYDVFLLENGSIMFMDNVFEKLITSVKYLHQLQNLYFALTGEELTINL